MAALSRSAATAHIRRHLLPLHPRLLPAPIASIPTRLRPAHASFAVSRWHSSSVSPDEVSHFTAIASEWWDPHGSSRLLHLMNPLRHDFIRSCLAQQPSPSSHAPPSSSSPPPPLLTYLDIGCGGGIFAESAARLPSTASVTAIDPTPSVLAVAQAHARKDPSLAAKLRYQNCSIEELDPPPEGGSGYDVVTLFEVLEHIDDPAAFLDKVRPFVRPGGWLVMSTIARTWASWVVTNLVAEDLLRIVPPGTHTWDKYINREELEGFLAGRGWECPRVMGVVYVPGMGWREVKGGESIGNYFFAVRRELAQS
ncbi:Hexaprenyldihydroxybenzoate methyltransferase [Escovopsis weberi]|uniref:Ubiquinone biosynthesis O-methyltransferase, mitochondrial n=1 Tax=Escovopsis weberi TaxID=150374 RepID=A0A0M8MUU0_ESCWE|nr:Hexaprenyldihydroxybenzoate methyltransferase [Escovopsis weberi]